MQIAGIFFSGGNFTGHIMYLHGKMCSTVEGKLGLACTAPILY